jgi:hypothetical protein
MQASKLKVLSRHNLKQVYQNPPKKKSLWPVEVGTCGFFQQIIIGLSQYQNWPTSSGLTAHSHPS